MVLTVMTSLAFRTGKGRSKRASAKLKMAVLAPIPIASDSAAITVNPGLFASTRKAWRISWKIIA
jgi:hypothetical protein